jgi:hypothetical protein
MIADQSGKYGWVYAIDSNDALRVFLDQAPSTPVVVLIPPHLFIKYVVLLWVVGVWVCVCL